MKPAQAPGAEWRETLAARPVGNQAARAEPRPNGGVCLTVRKRRPGFLIPPLSWVLRPRLTQRCELDELGARVWRLCDGTRTVEAIVDALAAEWELTFHEARVAVSGYLQQLIRRAAVVLVMAPQRGDARP